MVGDDRDRLLTLYTRTSKIHQDGSESSNGQNFAAWLRHR
jgi:hypothetical protein